VQRGQRGSDGSGAEPILFLQSSHGSSCAASNNIEPLEPRVLFETYDAFGIYGQGQQTGWPPLWGIWGHQGIRDHQAQHVHVQLQQPRPGPADKMGT
jgi:hypothetical protein